MKENSLQKTPNDEAVKDSLIFPVSASQQRLYFLDKLNPGSAAYNMSQAFRLSGELNYNVLSDSINAVIQRHEALRTTFSEQDDQPVQLVQSKLFIDLPVVDFNEQSENITDDFINSKLDDEFQQAFDLSTGPLIRAKLFKIKSDEHILIIIIHHINFDRRSDGLLNFELSCLYNNALKNASLERPAPPELNVQYSDYTLWRAQKNQGESLNKLLNYWKKKLTNIDPIELPIDRPRSNNISSAGERLYLELPTELINKFEALASKEGATLFMGLLAVFNALLHLWTGSDDIIVGTPFADRRLKGTEKLLGFFVSTLVLRNDLSQDPDFNELLNRVRKTCFNAYRYNGLPFEKLVEELKPERQLNRNPIFDIEFALQKAHSESLNLDNITASKLTPSKGTAQYDLTLTVREKENSYDARVEFRTDLFESKTISRLLQRFKRLLEEITESPSKKLSELSLLDENEKHKILVDWNNTKTDYPNDKCIHQLFEQQAKISPDAIAVISGTDKISYQQLNEKSNQLAHYLTDLNVGPEQYVGVCLDRTVDMVIALLAILKAGGAYLPLDKSYPADRLTHMLEDSKISVLLTQSNIVDILPEHTARDILLDTDRDLINAQSTTTVSLKVKPTNVAYVIYTSGSTGKPKGVQVEHKNVVNFLTSMQTTPGLNSNDVLLAVTTLSFDIAVLELYLPLISGATIIIASHEEAIDGDELNRLIIEHKVSFMQATPVSWRLLIAADWQGSHNFKALCGGEAMPKDLADELLKRCSQLWNMYGPTETTVWSSCYQITDSHSSILIGRPINNTQMYILDSNMQAVSPGTPGELYIGGDGVTRGYLNRADLSSERFVINPFSEDTNARLYLTGDSARHHNDGNIEYHNRLDNQVKIRGNRIELGEIESELAKHNAIKQCMIMIREDQPGDARLVSYMVTQDDRYLDATELRQFLRNSLPNHMIPQFFIEVEDFPLTPNGKINYKLLPAPDSNATSADRNYVAPRNQQEKNMAEIWQQALGVEQIGLYDNFIELGGHSLLALQVISKIKRQMKVTISPASMIMDNLEQIVTDAFGIDNDQNIKSNATIQENLCKPFYFPNKKNSLFGMYHPAQPNNKKDHAVLLCYPLYMEGLNAHWVFHQLANQLSKNGFDVLRFDYFATGDSSGEDHQGNPEHWVSDINAAANQLMQLSKQNSISLIGLRFGATLAALSHDIMVKNLILWDPVVNGEEYLKHLIKHHNNPIIGFNQKTNPSEKPHPEELFGFACTDDTRQSIKRINLEQDFSCTAEKIYLFTSSDKMEYLQLNNTLQTNNKKFINKRVEDIDSQIEAYRELSVFLPSNILRAINSALNGKIS